mmetsp:Transcript_42008/g.69469  ORF Transcript_42008/g.69469 Transcript_42008/m.69469 type:complete len:109 (+) Transcript_42008:549-875(+)
MLKRQKVKLMPQFPKVKANGQWDLKVMPKANAGHVTMFLRRLAARMAVSAISVICHTQNVSDRDPVSLNASNANNSLQFWTRCLMMTPTLSKMWLNNLVRKVVISTPW